MADHEEDKIGHIFNTEGCFEIVDRDEETGALEIKNPQTNYMEGIGLQSPSHFRIMTSQKNETQYGESLSDRTFTVTKVVDHLAHIQECGIGGTLVAGCLFGLALADEVFQGASAHQKDAPKIVSQGTDASYVKITGEAAQHSKLSVIVTPENFTKT